MLRFLSFVLCITLAPWVVASPLAVGDTLAPITISDQHGQSATLDENTRVLLFSRDMTANKLAKAAFLSKPAQYLAEAKTMYLIDVSGMPSFVTNNFAIPKMKKYPYRIFLDREASMTANLPSQKAQITVLHLDHLKVQSIEYLRDASALIRTVEAPSP
jgi:hypothetical protein